MVCLHCHNTMKEYGVKMAIIAIDFLLSTYCTRQTVCSLVLCVHHAEQQHQHQLCFSPWQQEPNWAQPATAPRLDFITQWHLKGKNILNFGTQKERERIWTLWLPAKLVRSERERKKRKRISLVGIVCSFVWSEWVWEGTNSLRLRRWQTSPLLFSTNQPTFLKLRLNLVRLIGCPVPFPHFCLCSSFFFFLGNRKWWHCWEERWKNWRPVYTMWYNVLRSTTISTCIHPG